MKPKKGGRTPEGLYALPNAGSRFGAVVKRRHGAGLRSLQPSEVLFSGDLVQDLLRKKVAGAKILEACLESSPTESIIHRPVKGVRLLVPVEGEGFVSPNSESIAEIPPNDVN